MNSEAQIFIHASNFCTGLLRKSLIAEENEQNNLFAGETSVLHQRDKEMPLLGGIVFFFKNRNKSVYTIILIIYAEM